MFSFARLSATVAGLALVSTSAMAGYDYSTSSVSEAKIMFSSNVDLGTQDVGANKIAILNYDEAEVTISITSHDNLLNSKTILIPAIVRLRQIGLIAQTRAGSEIALNFTEGKPIENLFGAYYGVTVSGAATSQLGARIAMNEHGVIIRDFMSLLSSSSAYNVFFDPNAGAEVSLNKFVLIPRSENGNVVVQVVSDAQVTSEETISLEAAKKLVP